MSQASGAPDVFTKASSVALFAVGKAPTNGQAFDEAMYAVAGGLALRAGTSPSSTGPVFAGLGNNTAPIRLLTAR